MSESLMPHQLASLEEFRAHHGRMLLWSDPGNGKTAVALVAAERTGASTLFVCPAIVRQQVLGEVRKFTSDLHARVVTGDADARALTWKVAKQEDDDEGPLLFIISYETLVADIEYLKKINWKLIIVDECQRIASPGNKCAKLLKKIPATYRLAMSGTPFPNATHEMWSVIHWLDPLTPLGKSFYEFRRLHCRTNPYIPQQITGYVNEEEIKRIVALHTHRVFRRDAQTDVPKLEERVQFTDLPDVERRRYDEFKRELVLELESGEKLTVPNVLASLMRLRQLVDCPGVFDEKFTSQKLNVATFIIAGWLTSKEKEKVIVFSEFKEPLKILNNFYAGLSEVIDGDTPQKRRQEILKGFADSQFPLLLLSSAGQVGLNIQTANKILHYGSSWNQARMDQRTARAHRKGQTRAVESVILLARDTVDEHMHDLCLKKGKLNKEDLMQLLHTL